MKCPSCEYENIPGDDLCSECGDELTSVNIYQPASDIEESIIQNPVIRIKPRPSINVKRDRPIMDVVKLINANRSSVLIINDDKSLAGIATERDVLYKASALGLDLKTSPIEKIMTANPETIHADDSIACAINIMSVGGFRNVPILQDNKPAYVITIWDILRYIAENK